MSYRGLDVFGMAPPSSGGSTVGEALNILETVELGQLGETQSMHYFLEASALAFADRNRWVGDSDVVDVPLDELLSDGFAAERACLIDPTAALTKPVAPGAPDGSYAECGVAGAAAGTGSEGLSTTHLTTADRWGNVVAYTLTIESTGGNGIVVPDRGFLLNNELTDFNFTDTQGGQDPNLPGPGKRPRSSMSPTIVLSDGEPLLALGSPGGSTIITTVLQILVNRLDLGMDLAGAVAAPRATQRNTAAVQAEPGFPPDAAGRRWATPSPTTRRSERRRASSSSARARCSPWPNPRGVVAAAQQSSVPGSRAQNMRRHMGEPIGRCARRPATRRAPRWPPGTLTAWASVGSNPCGWGSSAPGGSDSSAWSSI